MRVCGGRTAQADYPEIMANFSLRLRVKIGKAMVIRAAGKSFFGNQKNSFESRIAGMMDTYEDTNEKETTTSIP